MEFFHEPKIDWMGIKWYFICSFFGLGVDGDCFHGGSPRIGLRH